MAGNRRIEVVLEDKTPNKWRIPLAEDCFKGYLTNSTNNNMISKVFGEASSFFSPMLFSNKFFDPSDAFPLWDFEADVLLSNLRLSGFHQVNWFQTDGEFVLKSELAAGVGEDSIQVCIEKGKILEISGQYRKHHNPDWKSGHWWEHGFIRRIELPENADWKKTEAILIKDLILEIKIPKSSTGSPSRSGSISG